ncbi:MAG: guanylate kinase [Verrucomicrobia bacterium]|nr:guanylate kinase [Verrucomicrobiota bacterium]
MEFLNSKPIFLVVSAPSGGGKTTVCNRLLTSDLGLQRAITCTTRAPRSGEVDGKDYYFLTKDQFESKKAADEFLEWANVYGNFYGTLKSEIIRRLEAGQDVIVSVDVQGVASIAKMARNDPVLSNSFVSLFIALPSIEALRKRLEGRGSDSPEVIQKRLDTARAEMQTCGGFDYILLSGSMDEDYERAYAIVLAEKMKRSRVSQSDLEKYIGLFH